MKTRASSKSLLCIKLGDEEQSRQH